jgi:glucokinase
MEHAAGHLLGIALESALIRAALVNADTGETLASHTAGLEPEENIAAQLGARAREWGAEYMITAAGVAVPGLVSRATNSVEISRALPALAETDFYGQLTEALGVPVWLDNDANAAAYGEFRQGAGRGHHEMFYAMIGAGIGGAFILHGHIWRGATGHAGEFGHTTINVETDTTLEYVASAANIVRRTHDRLMRDSTSSLSPLDAQSDFNALDIARAAHEGDDFALMMLARTGNFIGAGLANVINLLNVGLIVVGGETARAAGPLLLEPIKREAARLSFGPSFAATRIVSAELGEDGTALGAALLAGDELAKS